MGTIVYRYGLRAPIVGANAVDTQMRLAHSYRHTLTEIERRRRDRLRAIEAEDLTVAGLHAAMQAAQHELDMALEVARLERKRSGKEAPSRAVSAEHRDSIKQARADLKSCRKSWREARIASREEMAPKLDAANEQALAERKAARASCGVYWGTYQLVEDADGASHKMPLWLDGEPNDPRFARWDGCGEVSVQISDGVGLSVDDLSESRQLRILPSDAEDRRDPNSRRSRMRLRKRLLLRVGSNADRSPQFAEWPMIEHRPLPDGARIKRATVHRQMIGPRVVWFVTLTLTVPDPLPSGLDGVVAIDIGWRELADGHLRVATCHDPEGLAATDWELPMPVELIAAIERADTLRATRDKNFDAARSELRTWVNATRSMPGWFLDQTESLSAWKSQARLASLARKWRDARFDDDGEAFEAVEAWRKQDKHLWLWETSQRAKALARRRDYYRCLAAQLAEHYGTVILEDFDLRAVARRPAPGSAKESDYIKQAARNRTLAAVSELRSAIVNAFRMRGGSVHLIDPADTTRTCHVCGVVEEFDAAARLRHTCANGHEWDQDVNAARNLCERWRRAQEAGTARAADDSMPSETRWARAARLKRERDERMGRSQGAEE